MASLEALGAAWALGALALALPLLAADPDLPLRLRAYAVHPSGGPTGIVHLTVDEWSTPEEHRRLLEAVDRGDDVARGDTELRATLQSLEPRGRIAFRGQLGVDLRYAHLVDLDGTKRIVLAADRPIGVDEAMSRDLSLDYDVTLVILELDEFGQGEGSLWIAAAIALRPDERLEPRGVDGPPIRLGRVRVHN